MRGVIGKSKRGELSLFPKEAPEPGKFASCLLGVFGGFAGASSGFKQGWISKVCLSISEWVQRVWRTPASLES